jgi:O-antigen/teichoic acid export membrane protein
VLGQKWTAAIVPLQILVLYASVRSLTPILAQALTVAGDTRYTMMRSVVAAVCMPIGFLVGSRWGIVGIASAWIVVHAPLVVAPLFRRATTRLGVSPTAYFAAIRPAAVSSIIMAIVVIAGGYALGGVLSDGPRLTVKVVLGAATYAACLGGVFRARVMAVVSALRRASGGAQAAAAT